MCHVLHYLLVMLECIESMKLGLKNVIGKREQIILKRVILLIFIDYNGLKNVLFCKQILILIEFVTISNINRSQYYTRLQF
jgi:hypothetical protein